MYHMRTVSVRDLRYDFKMIEGILREGEEVSVTKRRRVIARLVPEPASPAKLPDFLGRLRITYGDDVLKLSGAEIVRKDRDRY
jgi:antitoxin (DNA-binding transcriptional repressor) of toxin-antitoxin stability system